MRVVRITMEQVNRGVPRSHPIIEAMRNCDVMILDTTVVKNRYGPTGAEVSESLFTLDAWTQEKA